MNGQWTYGAELEFSDWDRRRGIPAGFGLDERDVTMVNSNGIAVDPKGILYPYGGEFNTPPTYSPAGQGECLHNVLFMHPETTINYRSNLHIHVRIPGLKDDLDLLKSLALFNLQWLPRVLSLVEPIPLPKREDYPIEEEFQGAMKRYKRRCRSHHTMLLPGRVAKQLTATTPAEFHALEVPWVRGKPQPFLQPRAAINIRQLQETDTLEFRHFPGTLEPMKLVNCVEWCRDYLLCWLGKEDPVRFWFNNYHGQNRIPTFPPYIHWMELRYRRTVHDGTVPKESIKRNIEEILREDSSVVPR